MLGANGEHPPTARWRASSEARAVRLATVRRETERLATLRVAVAGEVRAGRAEARSVEGKVWVIRMPPASRRNVRLRRWRLWIG